MKRKLTFGFSLALIIALMLATTGAAFALTNGFGILDFVRNSRGDVEVPEDAEQYIDHDLAVSETEHFTVRFRETSYDGKTCHLVYDVIPKSKDILLFNCPTDESWYGLTHLSLDREALAADNRTILDRWDEGGYASAWEVDTDVNSGAESIVEYSEEGVLDEETGILTGKLEISFASIEEERTLGFCVRILPLLDIHDEFSYDYDRAEEGVLTRVFQAAASGEEKVLVNTEPIEIPSIGVRIDQARLMVLPQEVQYQIDYSVSDPARFHALFDVSDPETDRTVVFPPYFRFVSIDPDTRSVSMLARGITDNFSQFGDTTQKEMYSVTGSLGRSAVAEEYTLAVFDLRDLPDASLLLDTATFRVRTQ